MDNLALIPATMCLTKVVLAAGTTSTLSTTNAATYAIRGKLYVQSAAWLDEATPTTDLNGNPFTPIPAGNGSVFVVGVDHSGNMKVSQGQIQALDSSGNFVVAPQFGSLGPDGSASTDGDFCPLAYVVVKASTGAANWTFGTSNFAGPPTDVTFSFQDVATLPDRPQVA
ncbi:MAG: hypothetical protein ACP5QR_14465 [Rhizomicrobium sp.]